MESSYKKVDQFSLFNSTNLPDSYLDKTKTFLSEKFLISFDSISSDIKRNMENPMGNIVDNIYSAVYSNAIGFSFDMVNDTTYGVYTHTDRLLSTNYTLIKELDLQIKLHCIISTLYTLSSILEASYGPLISLPIQYANKKYDIGSNRNLKEALFEGYSPADTTLTGKLRYAYNSLIFPIPTVSDNSNMDDKLPDNPSDEDLNNVGNNAFSKCANCYLANAFNFTKKINDSNNHKIESLYYIQSFLNEFSLDLLVNQMHDGFNLIKKLHTLEKNRQKPYAFHRETRRFLDGLTTIENNFFSIGTDPLLYNWKKESLFHLNMLTSLIDPKNDFIGVPYTEILLNFPTMTSFSPLMTLLKNTIKTAKNSDNILFLLNYLSGITIPVFTYTFFIAICDYFKYSFEEICEILIQYLQNHQISMDDNKYSTTPHDLNKENIDLIGNALCKTYFSPPFSYIEPFEFSFPIPKNLDNDNLDNDHLEYIQSDLGLHYYQRILS